MKKIAVVTGSSSGFGLLSCIALARADYFVIASMRNLENKLKLAAAAEKAGVSDGIEYLMMDVTEPSTIEQAIDHVIAHYGRIDLLLNNAGFALGGVVEELSLDQWHNQFETNFFGLISVTKAVLPYMREQASGKIINISSISGRIAFPGMAPYVASKHAVEGFTEALRLEMLPFNVQVVLIEPGSYKTEIWGKGLADVTIRSHSPYSEQMSIILRQVQKIVDNASEPDEVIETIMQAVKAKNPRLRYPVGKGVKMTLFLKNLLPWNWIENMIAKQLRIRRSRR